MSSFGFSNHKNQYRSLRDRDISWLENAIVQCATLFFTGFIINSIFWCICHFLDDVFPKNPLTFLYDVIFLPLEIFFLTMTGVMGAAGMLCIVMSKD